MAHSEGLTNVPFWSGPSLFNETPLERPFVAMFTNYSAICRAVMAPAEEDIISFSPNGCTDDRIAEQLKDW
jgi:hypothetical protein